MNNHDHLFLERRRKLLRHWRYAGPILLVAIIGLGVYLWFTAPMLINPFAVGAELTSTDLDASTLSVAALMLPVVVLLLLAVLLLIVLFLHAAFSNERRYLEMLDDNDKGAE